jgi:hypothetical protein
MKWQNEIKGLQQSLAGNRYLINNNSVLVRKPSPFLEVLQCRYDVRRHEANTTIRILFEPVIDRDIRKLDGLVTLVHPSAKIHVFYVHEIGFPKVARQQLFASG